MGDMMPSFIILLYYQNQLVMCLDGMVQHFEKMALSNTKSGEPTIYIIEMTILRRGSDVMELTTPTKQSQPMKLC